MDVTLPREKLLYLSSVGAFCKKKRTAKERTEETDTLLNTVYFVSPRLLPFFHSCFSSDHFDTL